MRVLHTLFTHLSTVFLILVNPRSCAAGPLLQIKKPPDESGGCNHSKLLNLTADKFCCSLFEKCSDAFSEILCYS